ncbi:MAG: hypothetical protein RLZZ203_2060, partial [Cyanobacteriota bacterium]
SALVALLVAATLLLPPLAGLILSNL